KAERRSARLGIGADRVLVSEGSLSEEDYLATLAASLGIAYQPLDELPRRACPLDGRRLLEAAAAGLLPLRVDGQPVWVIAPRGLAARLGPLRVFRRPELAPRIRLTSTASLNRFIARHAARALATNAAEALRLQEPELSAAPRRRRLTL